MAKEARILFTIGHTTHSINEFVSLLKQHGVTAIADVRSQPYSSRLEQFNREPLATALNAAGILYSFFGEELGARRVEEECYDGDRADYNRIAVLPKFLEGLNRLRKTSAQYRIALLCAEKEPLDCHRTILICRYLRDEFDILHILSDGTIEDHPHAEMRLVHQMGVSLPLFDQDIKGDLLIQAAYDKRSLQIAYRIREERVPQ